MPGLFSQIYKKKEVAARNAVPVAVGPNPETEVRWPTLILPYIKNDRVRLCPDDVRGKENSFGLNELLFADLPDHTDQATLRK